jgi:shikimate dehydrogenase
MRKRLAVLGQPISHSRSPAMHSAALAELGLAKDWSYEAIEVSSEDFEDRVRAMPGEGFVGANVTVPHKLAALELADAASEAARAIGAAHTLSFADERIAADNTDAVGFLDSLPEPPAGRRTLVLGAGGSARAVVWALATSGADVHIWNRTPSRAESIASRFGAQVASLGPQASDVRPQNFDLLVNATSVGMGTGASAGSGTNLKALPLDADFLGEIQLLVDLAYGPAETELSRLARERGTAVVDGLEVLVRQGAASLRIWTGQDPPIETMRRAARASPTRWPSTSSPDT